MHHRPQRERHSEEGIALLEFVITLPVLLLLFIGSFEIARYQLFKEKVESAATQILNVLNQSGSVGKSSLDNLYSVFPEMIKPFAAIDAHIIVTAIVNPADGSSGCKAVALWQYPPGGSRIAPKVFQPVDMKAINLLGGDNAMAIEVFADYQPLVAPQLVQGIIGGTVTQYAYTYSHTRYGEFKIDPNSGKVVDLPGSDNVSKDAKCVTIERATDGPTANRKVQ